MTGIFLRLTNLLYICHNRHVFEPMFLWLRYGAWAAPENRFRARRETAAPSVFEKET